MKKTLLIFTLSFIFNYSFAQLTFSKVYYDSSAFIHGNAIVQTPDKGYMIVGIQNFGGLVIKLDSAGGQIWKKNYSQVSATSQNGFYCIAPTNDSCYLVAGAMSSSFDANIFCMKIDGSGDTLWTRTLPTPEESEIFSVQQTYDHGYIMAGRYRTNTAPYLSIGVVKLDSTGNLEWRQVITSTGYTNYPNTIKQTPDSGYVIWGTLNNFGTGDYACLIKISPSGTVQWSKIYNYAVPGQINCYSLEILNDGFISFLIADNNPYKGILMKMDFNGNIIWSKSNGYVNGTVGWFTAKIHQINDGGFIIAIGYQVEYGPGYIWRADSSGNFLWAKEVFMNPIEAIETFDNGYLILGNGTGQCGVAKTDSLGDAPSCIGLSFSWVITDTLVATNITTTTAPMGTMVHINTTINIPSIYDANGCPNYLINVNEIKPENQSMDISPNPSTGDFVLEFSRNLTKGLIEIYNPIGEKVWSENINNESKKEIHLENISPGIYFVKVLDEKKMFTQKIIIQ